MKHLKKYMSLMLGILLLTSLLAGCKGKDNNGNSGASGNNNSEDTSQNTDDKSKDDTGSDESADKNSEEYPADVQKIIDRGVLRVGVKNAVIGFGYQDPLTQEYSGLEITLAGKIAEYLGIHCCYGSYPYRTS